MKKYLRIVLVSFVCTVLSFPVWSNPTPVYAGKISHLYFFEDGSFVLELYFMWLGEEDDIVLSGSSGCTLIDVSDVNVGDFLIIDSSEYPDLELDPTDGTLNFFETFYLVDNYNSVFSIGTSAYDDVRPIPLGCGISNLTYSSENADSKYVYDTQLNLMQSQPVTKGVVKASVYNLQDELLSGFIIGVQSSAVEESFCSSDDGFYYLNIYWDATMETTASLSNLANTIEYKSMTGTPLDTTYITFTYNVPSSISFTGTVELEGQTNHEGSYVYLESYNPDHDILYYKIINEDGTFALEIPSGVYRLAYFHDHYTPNLTGNFLPYLESKNVFKSLQEEEMVVNLISPFRESPLVDSTYYLFSDIFVPANNTLDIYNDAAVILPLPKEIMVEGTVNITGVSDNPISFSTDYNQSPFCLFNIIEETGSVFINYAEYEDFTTVFNLESSTLEVSNTNFIDNELIICGNGSASAHVDNCLFEACHPDSNLFVLKDNSYAEIDNCMFQNMKVFDIYDHAHIRIDSSSMLNCEPSVVWDYGVININYSTFDNTTIGLNRYAQSRINHSTFLNNNYALHYWLYGDYYGNYPDTSMVLQNSVFFNNFCHVTDVYYGNGYLYYNQFYPYEERIYFSNAQDIGIMTTVNNNNDSCDIYNNIVMDPLLKDDYHLTWNSPCINAGDPNTPKDPDSTITDMGAYFYDLSTLIQEARNDQALFARSYPNPATEQVTFDISHENGISGTAVITLYNLEGVPVATAYEPLPPTESLTRKTIPLKNRGLATGLYVYTIEVPGRKSVGGKLSIVH